MKRIIYLLLSITLWSCGEDSDDSQTPQATVGLTFSHNWDGETITFNDFNTIQYTNANGEELSVEKLRYLISNISFQNPLGEVTTFEGYNLIDLSNNSTLSYSPNILLPSGTYMVSFTFGFDNEDNYNHSYPDLNAALWNVPEMMGGGYHYMQLEGKFVDANLNEVGYAYHSIQAVNMSDPDNLIFENTFFTVNLGAVEVQNQTTIDVKMNLAEWFKNPNQWDLNVLNNSLMANYDAQILMYQNGQNVFSLGSVTN